MEHGVCDEDSELKLKLNVRRKQVRTVLEFPLIKKEKNMPPWKPQQQQ